MKNLLKRLFASDYPYNLSSLFAGFVVTMITWKILPQETVQLPVFLLVCFLSLILAVVLAHELSICALQRDELLKEKTKMQSEMELLHAQLSTTINAMPIVKGAVFKPHLRLITTKSPLFTANTDLTIMLIGEMYERSETPLCYGKVVHLQTSDASMEIEIDFSSFEESSIGYLKELLTDRLKHPHLVFLPKRIPLSGDFDVNEN